MKIKEVLDKTIQFFRDKKMDQARLEAEWLIGAGLKMDRVQLYLKFDQPLKENELVSLREMVRRRAQGEPLAYITGTRGFYGFDFKVGPQVLIPRPETETLVEKALEYMATLSEDKEIQVLDLGCGSGCIGLTLAKKKSNVKVTLVDVSAGALSLAQENAKALEVTDKVQFVEADAAQFLLKTSQKFDLILANPPYIPPKDPHVEENVKKFEPALALYAEGGTSLLKTWSTLASQNLSETGFVLMEMGFDQGQEMKQHFASLKTFERVEILKDLAQLDRVILGEKRSVTRG